MPYPHGFKEVSQRDLKNQSQASSSYEASREKLQHLRHEAYRFTAMYAQEQRDYASRVERGEDRGKRRYDPKLERSVDEHGKHPEKMEFDPKRDCLLGGLIDEAEARSRLPNIYRQWLSTALTDNRVERADKQKMRKIWEYVRGNVQNDQEAVTAIKDLANKPNLNTFEKQVWKDIGIRKDGDS